MISANAVKKDAFTAEDAEDTEESTILAEERNSGIEVEKTNRFCHREPSPM